jgi:tRNA1(Val) A37 N6-methylase TrmN6
MDFIDELWPGGPKYKQTDGVFKLGSDSVLLAAFAPVKRAKTVCDLGCGGGVLPVILHERNPNMKIDGVELDEKAAGLCRYNAELNGLGGHFRLIEGDIREYRSLLAAGGYDLTVSNPPYFPQGSGYESETLAHARGEAFCSLEELCSAAAYITRWGGSFCLVYRPERLSELFCALSSHALEPKRLRLVQHSASSAPNLVLAEAKRGAKPGLQIEPPLIMTDASGGDSAEIKSIYRRGE